jgi:precorrin-6B methylase 2
MVQYQPTPARVILELVEKSRLTSVDIFCDVGSGLGRVPILVNLLSGAAARGIEVQPAYCDYARACAAELNLPRVEFTNADARTADLSEGTVFYLYTPFTGGMLQEVLTRLQDAAHGRMIRLFTYGPCTPHVAGQGWLKHVGRRADHLDELAAFESTVP